MRIIFLNTWGGRIKTPFRSFLQNQAKNTDFFCFQEVSPTLFAELQSILPGHKGLYEEGWDLKIDQVWYGQAVFIRPSLVVKSFGNIHLFKSGEGSGFMQFVFLQINRKNLGLGVVHGKAKPGHKLDTPSRIKQSRTIIDFFKDEKCLRIVGGDFNLLPETKSVAMFEKNGYRNLIKEFKVQDTRGKLNHKQFKAEDIQYFADYCFVSDHIKIRKFEVPNVEVSDHLPLILDFEI